MLMDDHFLGQVSVYHVTAPEPRWRDWSGCKYMIGSNCDHVIQWTTEVLIGLANRKEGVTAIRGGNGLTVKSPASACLLIEHGWAPGLYNRIKLLVYIPPPSVKEDR